MIENKLCELTNRDYAIPVRSGTDALQLSLLSYNIGIGDEVLVSNFSWVSTASCISMVCATPVFCDVDLDTYHISMSSVRKMVSEKTKALIFPHLFGSMMQTNELVSFCKENNILLIEDACQSVGCILNGSPAGSIGDISTLSFNLNKVVSGITGGGAILTNDDIVASKLKKLSHHGYGKDFEYLGINGRMSDVDKIEICRQLDTLQETIAERNVFAENYDRFFKSFPVKMQKIPERLYSNRHKYTLRFESKEIRDRIKNIFGCKVHYSKPISENTMYKNIIHRKDRCPNSQLISDTILTLPMEGDKKPMNEIYKLLVEKIFNDPNYGDYTMKEQLSDALFDIARG